MDTRPPTCSAIRAAVCAVWDVSKDEIVSQRRDAQIVDARHAALWLSRRLTNKTLDQISRLYGGRDHSTILNAVRRIDRVRHFDPDMAENLELAVALLNCRDALDETPADRRVLRARAIRIIARIERDLAELRALLIDDKVPDGPHPDRQGGVA